MEPEPQPEKRHGMLSKLKHAVGLDRHHSRSNSHDYDHDQRQAPAQAYPTQAYPAPAQAYPAPAYPPQGQQVYVGAAGAVQQPLPGALVGPTTGVATAEMNHNMARKNSGTDVTAVAITTGHMAPVAPLPIAPLPAPAPATALPRTQVGRSGVETMVLGEEQLDVSKRAVSMGALEVLKHTGSVLVNVPVLLRREFVVLTPATQLAPHLIQFKHVAHAQGHGGHTHHTGHTHTAGRDDASYGPDASPVLPASQQLGTATVAQVITSSSTTSQPKPPHPYDGPPRAAAPAPALAPAPAPAPAIGGSVDDGEGEVVMRMVVMAEQPVITMRMVAVEEIIVRRRRVIESQQIDEVVRRERAEVHDHRVPVAGEAKHPGVVPVGGESRVASTGTSSGTGPSGSASVMDEQGRVAAFEERLAVGKRTVAAGEVTVTKRTEERRATASIALAHDTLHVERRALQLDATSIPVAAAAAPSSQQMSVGEAKQLIQLMREEAVVSKHVVPVEEVTVRTGVVQEQHTVRAELAAERIDVVASGEAQAYPQQQQQQRRPSASAVAAPGVAPLPPPRPDRDAAAEAIARTRGPSF